MKKVLIVVLAILIVGGIGYGFYGGYKTKAFAQKSQDLLAASESRWQVDKLNNPDDEMSGTEAKDYYTKIKDDSASALSLIQKQGSTSKVKNLKQNVVRYYTLSQKAAENALTLADYLILMEQVEKDMENANISATGTEQLQSQLEQLKKALDKDLELLKKAKTTPSIEKINKDMISAFTDMSNWLGDAVAALEANQPEKVEGIMTEFSSAAQQLSKVNMPNENDIKNDILTSSEQNEMKDLATKIKDESNQLKNTIFAF